VHQTCRAWRRARIFRITTVVLSALALGATMLAPAASGAAATGSRSAQVTPAANLSDQVALVTWQGFRPTLSDGSYGVTIMECRLHPESVNADCNTANTFPLSLTGNQATGVTQANGIGDAFIDIESSGRLPALACSHTNPCSLLLYENTPDGFDPDHLPADFVIVELDFRESQADCPPPQRFDVRLETEASASAALYQWAADLCSVAKPLIIDVTNTSSDASRKQFFLKHVDLGVSSLPPAPGEVTNATPAFAVAPIDLTALVVAYNIFDPVTGHQITDVTLTPRLVARLVSDTDVLGFFQDPEFKELNPHHSFPNEAADPGLRAEQNADASIVTNWLNADRRAQNFLDGSDSYGIPVNDAWRGIQYPTNIFEARNPNGVYLPRTGEENIAQRLFHSTKPADSTAKNPADVGFFGILDLPIASRFRLPIAKLTTGVGAPVVTVSPATIEAGYKAMTTSQDGFHVEPAAPADPAAWPLSKVDHAMVPTTKTADGAARSAAIGGLLRYAAGPGQQDLPDGFVPLPDALSTQTLRIAAALESSPSTTAATTATATATTGTATTTATTNAFGFAGGTYSNGSATAAPFNRGAPTRAMATTIAPGVTPTSVPKRVAEVATSRAEPSLLLAAAGAERFALLIVLIIGLFALTLVAIDRARRRAPWLIASTRRRLERRRSAAS
jgi:hypothetical protein